MVASIGVETTRVLQRLYAASRLHTNFFQPSFKAEGQATREARKVIKRYHVPATALCARTGASEVEQGRQNGVFERFIARSILVALRGRDEGRPGGAWRRSVGRPHGQARGKQPAHRAPATNAAAFAKGLGNDVHLGEQRIIHRRMHKPYKKRMRMPSMLDPHLADNRALARGPSLV